jgi:hypothetical protein
MNIGRAESTLNTLIAQYDEDMNNKHKSLNELIASYELESAEYTVLKGNNIIENWYCYCYYYYVVLIISLFLLSLLLYHYNFNHFTLYTISTRSIVI